MTPQVDCDEVEVLEESWIVELRVAGTVSASHHNTLVPLI
jgi:hypothetical protein